MLQGELLKYCAVSGWNRKHIPYGVDHNLKGGRYRPGVDYRSVDDVKNTDNWTAQETCGPNREVVDSFFCDKQATNESKTARKKIETAAKRKHEQNKSNIQRTELDQQQHYDVNRE